VKAEMISKEGETDWKVPGSGKMGLGRKVSQGLVAEMSQVKF